jgi:aldose 1-epimerase
MEEYIMEAKKDYFGKAPNGKEAYLFTLTNDNGMIVKVTNFGGIVTSLVVPDKKGRMGDVALGYNTLEEYLKGGAYFGALIGRYANRIAKGNFKLNGREYQLINNEGENHLHGGTAGFDKVVWDAAAVDKGEEIGVKLSYLSQDGEEGYPGNLHAVVNYLLNNKNELIVLFEAETDNPTIINLTNHSYFNLAGDGNGDVLGHEITINAGRFTELNENYIPTGEIKPVNNTPYDFTQYHKIGERIAQTGSGYDINYVLNKNKDELSLAAKVYEKTSGRIMEVFTTQPGLQFYTGNFLSGFPAGKTGKSYKKKEGFALEAQHFPDSPNHPGFPSTVLNPGQVFRQAIIFKFTA